MSDNWNAEFDKEAAKDLECLATSLAKNILAKIKWLCDNFDTVTPQPLGGQWRGFFKLRVGDYRVIYEIHWDRELIIISFIDHRSKAYKRKH